MGQIIFYLAIAALCVAAYFFLSSEKYFREDNTARGRGVIRQIVGGEKTEQYQVMFVDDMGIQRTVLTPKYAASKRYNVGDEVPIRYMSIKAFNKAILSVRIEDLTLQKQESYSTFLGVAGLLVALAAIKVMFEFVI